MTEELCLLTRLRKWHAANLPEVDSAYDPMNIQDMIPEVIDRIEDLESALRTLIASCDSGRRVPKFGGGGMTVQTNIQSSWIHNVEAWAVEEARAALGNK